MTQIKATAAKNAITPVDRTPSGRLPAVVAEAGREHTDQPAGPCPVFRDCNVPETGHFDHSAHDMKVLDERDSSTVLDAGMVALSGDEDHVIVYVGVAEYADLDALKAKTQELRRFLDEVDAMADRVFADHQARG